MLKLTDLEGWKETLETELKRSREEQFRLHEVQIRLAALFRNTVNTTYGRQEIRHFEAGGPYVQVH